MVGVGWLLLRHMNWAISSRVTGSSGQVELGVPSVGQAVVMPVAKAQSMDVSAQWPLIATMVLGSVPRLTMPHPWRWSGESA